MNRRAAAVWLCGVAALCLPRATLAATAATPAATPAAVSGVSLAGSPTTSPATHAVVVSDLAPGVARCTQQLRPQDDVGYARIAARCPELARLLSASTLAPWLPRGWNEPHNDLSAAGLSELPRLQRNWLAPAPRASRLAQPAQLRALVEQLHLHAAERNSLWQRFRSWLRSLFDRQKPSAEEAASLSDWLRAHGFSDDSWSAVQWGAFALLALLLGRVLWLELRALHWQRRQRAGGNASALAASLPTLADIDAAPPLQQPGMLLALSANLLARRRQLRGAAALTAREVVRDAQGLDAVQRAQLNELAAAAEPARFAAVPPQPPLLQRAATAGKSLLRSLQIPGAS